MKFKLQTFTETLIPIIYKLDKTFYGETVKPDWYNRYVNKAKIVMCYCNNELAGYLIAARITKKLFNEIISCKYSGDISINPNSFAFKSHYYYLSSVLVLTPYQGKGIATKLQDIVFNKVLQNKKVCTICVTDGGESLAKKHLSFIGKRNNSKIYSN